jgi:hypothetical protein
LLAFLAVIGVAVVLVIGSIALNAFKNHGLMPPPDVLDEYTCADAAVPVSLYFLHGTERVRIKTASGLLQGTVNQNRFDWRSNAISSTVLGFSLPTEISFEDAKAVRISGPDFTNLVCSMGSAHSSHRREIY